MVVCRHSDGRIIVMAKEHGLKPMLKSGAGKWEQAVVTGEELDEFVLVTDKRQREAILREALASQSSPVSRGPAVVATKSGASGRQRLWSL